MDVDISATIPSPFGIYEYGTEIYIADVGGKLYQINKIAPYTLTLVDIVIYSIFGASQIPAYLTSNFVETTTTTTSSTTVAPTTTTTTSSTTVAPGALNFDAVFICTYSPDSIQFSIQNITGGVPFPSSLYLVGTQRFTSQAAALANTSWAGPTNGIGYGAVIVDTSWWLVVKDSVGTVVAKQVTSNCVTTTTTTTTANPCLNCLEQPLGVLIGNNEGERWDLCNLNIDKYSDGTEIPEVQDATEWANTTIGAWCSYGNNRANDAIYGKLYNWYAVAGIWDPNSRNTPSLRKKLIPPSSPGTRGKHVPTEAEWNELTTYLVNKHGEKMKEEGTCHWVEPNTEATNSSGFTGLPGGYRNANGDFVDLKNSGSWWSITPKSVTNENEAFAWGLVAGSSGIFKTTFSANLGFSVRLKIDKP
jgi:uncharacterized protein (TIGR02145 family)